MFKLLGGLGTVMLVPRGCRITVPLFIHSAKTGGVLTGERGNQSVHQSTSSVFYFDSWYDTHCWSHLMGGPLSASIRGDMHQVNLHTLY